MPELPFEFNIMSGHGYSLGSGFGADSLSGEGYHNTPEGYCYLKNLLFREDGVLRPPFEEASFGSAVGTGAIKLVAPGKNGRVFVITGNNLIYTSSNSGASWSQVTGLSVTFPDAGFSAVNYSGTQWIVKSTDTNQPTYKIEVGSLSFNYLFPSDTSKTYGSAVCTHENRVLVANGSMIRYSEVGDPTEGYDYNYVNVGSSNEDIKFMFDIRGGVLVIKENSIWLKNTIDEEGITSMQFDLVVSGFSTVKDARVFDGDLWILTYDGLWRYVGNALEEVSQAVRAEWIAPGREDDVWTLGYHRLMKHVYCSNKTTNTVYVFEVPKRRWMVIDGVHDSYCVANPTGKLIFADGTNQLKYINVNSYKDAGITFQTPFLDLGNSHQYKYLHGILLNYTGEMSVQAYGRKNVGGVVTEIPVTGEGATTKVVSDGERTGTGTISTDGETVMGTGTSFTTELFFLDKITAGGQTRQIREIVSNTELRVEGAFSPDLTGEAFTYSRDQDLEVLRVDGNTPWRDVSVKLTSDGAVTLKSVGMLIDVERRITGQG